LVVVEKYATERRFRAVLEQYASRVLIETCGDLRTLRLRWGPQVKVTHRDTSGRHAFLPSTWIRGFDSQDGLDQVMKITLADRASTG
jgi:hypothetical protein